MPAESEMITEISSPSVRPVTVVTPSGSGRPLTDTVPSGSLVVAVTRTVPLVTPVVVMA